MFNIKEIPQQELNEFFLQDPVLCIQGLPDHKLVDLHEKKEYIKDDISNILGVYYEEHLIFIFVYNYFTDICINVHFYLSTKHQSTAVFECIQKELREYLLEHVPKVTKIIAMTPGCCKHIQGACLKFGFTKAGHIEQAMTWRNQIEDILIYSLNLKE
ncbi:hypothetical protein UFOVP1_48 [uncultured Caudovirales phage]|uniref:Uncharacterized protein n=1 Tax=uncultured Caudovirales phage TaxID=2100421 RepID=A0A6J5KJC0_9CAUD|nr:hypothetical protein UFOVP1_48 [uncultured Caudovirales phage]